MTIKHQEAGYLEQEALSLDGNTCWLSQPMPFFHGMGPFSLFCWSLRDDGIPPQQNPDPWESWLLDFLTVVVSEGLVTVTCLKCSST